MSDLQDRVERIEEELGINQIDDPPSFRGYQMEERVGQVKHLVVWRDFEGDAWIEVDRDGPWGGDRDEALFWRNYPDELNELLEEANR